MTSPSWNQMERDRPGGTTPCAAMGGWIIAIDLCAGAGGPGLRWPKL